MQKEQMIEIYSKFPAILREKLMNDEVRFPAATQFTYEKILAYRGIVREEGDSTPVNGNDMKSYFEEGKRPRGQKYDESDPGLYAVSLYTQYEDFKNIFKFPRPRKKVAQGYISQERGPQCSSEASSHVNWWLYEDASFNDFMIKEELNG